MSIEFEKRVSVRCDGCGLVHRDPSIDNAMAARIAAGGEGWRYLVNSHALRKAGKRGGDFCPSCLTDNEENEQ